MVYLTHYVDVYLTTIECGTLPGERRECGYSGIDISACLERDCCYDDTVPGVHWCFLKRDKTEGASMITC